MCPADEISLNRNERSGASDNKQWFVMRDLTRPNAKLPAYKMLESLGINYFTPMEWRILTNRGKRERREVPCMQDLIFVHDSRHTLDELVDRIPTFQYRYLRGGYMLPMVVRDAEMERFIHAVHSSESPRYYRPEEITPDMCNRQIHIIGGQLDGYEGYLVTTRGSKVKRLLVEIPSLLAATVEVKTDYIRIL